MLQQLREEVQTKASSPENMALLIERLLNPPVPTALDKMSQLLAAEWNNDYVATLRSTITEYVITKRIRELNRKGYEFRLKYWGGKAPSYVSDFDVQLERDFYKDAEVRVVGLYGSEFVTALKKHLGTQLFRILRRRINGDQLDPTPPRIQ